MRTAVVVGLLLFTAACDDGGSPTAPTSRIPDIAGTYTGSLAFTSSLGSQFTTNVSARVTVVQAGSRVTLTGSLTVGGQSVEIPAVTGTVNATGFFTRTSGSLIDSIEDPTCGRVTDAGGSVTFSGRTVRIVDNATTQFCGNLQLSGTLTR